MTATRLLRGCWEWGLKSFYLSGKCTEIHICVYTYMIYMYIYISYVYIYIYLYVYPSYAAEARKLEHDRPPTPNGRKKQH